MFEKRICYLVWFRKSAIQSQQQTDLFDFSIPIAVEAYPVLLIMHVPILSLLKNIGGHQQQYAVPYNITWSDTFDWFVSYRKAKQTQYRKNFGIVW